LWKSGNRFSTKNVVAEKTCNAFSERHGGLKTTKFSANLRLACRDGERSSLTLQGAGPYPRRACDAGQQLKPAIEAVGAQA
jgi:hypothetical protein